MQRRAEATVHFMPAHLRRHFFIVNEESAVEISQRFRYGHFQESLALVLPFEGEGEAVAEEVFDLTNNPSRDDDRVACGYLNRRSLSVGDIVQVGDENWLCMSFGWQKL